MSDFYLHIRIIVSLHPDMYFHKSNFLLKKLYPTLTWEKPTEEKIVYLTFDDGPVPYLTEWVLDTLYQYKAKATFFCVGDNIRKYPEIFEKVKMQGHSVGNHTFNHVNGWKTPLELYLENIHLCQQFTGINTCLFRPPYGKITRKQAAHVLKSHQIIMWDVLSGDFDQKLSPAICLKKSIQYTQKGSIITFHDNVKAQKNLRYVLPEYLSYFSSQGYKFDKL